MAVNFATLSPLLDVILEFALETQSYTDVYIYIFEGEGPVQTELFLFRQKHLGTRGKMF